MKVLLLALGLLASWGSASLGDVSYVEEVTSIAKGQKGSQKKTVNRVYIKGRNQKVRSTIEADKKTAQVLEKQGQSLESSTILRLGEGSVYKIDHVSRTFVEDELPAAKPVATGKDVRGDAGGPEIQFRVKEMSDTTRIEGILCQRVAADMRSHYYDPTTKKLKKTNRYLYQAWVARDFPGYKEIRGFQAQQARQTSYPSLISGSLEQLRGRVEDFEALGDKIEVLEGFPMQSVLKVYVRRAGKEEKQIFQLTRTVNSLSRAFLHPSEFYTAKGFQKVKN